MNSVMAYLWFWCVIVSWMSLALGIFVLVNGPRKPVNVLWCFTCLSIAIWSMGYGRMMHAANFSEADFWSRWFLYPGSIVIPVIFMHFVSRVTGMGSIVVLRLAYGFAFMEIGLGLLGYFGTVVPTPPFHFYVKAYPLFSVYFVFFLVCVVYAHGLLWRASIASDGRKKQQIKYIGIGTAIGFSGGLTTFFYSYGLTIRPWGAFLVPVYILTVTYAIVKHQLMDIRIVVKKTLIYSTVTVLLTVAYVLIPIVLTRGLSRWIVTSTTVTTATAAGVIALLFHPLRMKVQRFVDRHFFREALDQALLREATGRFVHEIKRPLANISMPAQLALMDLKAAAETPEAFGQRLPQLEQRLQYIVDESLRASQKIEAIRDLSSNAAASSQPVDLALLVKHILNEEAQRIQTHKIRVDMGDGIAACWVVGDAPQLEVALANIVKNAVDALAAVPAERKRRLSVRLREKTDQVVLEFENSGDPIPEADLPHLFDPWFSRKTSGGMGLGLYLTKEILVRHHSVIDVRSRMDATAFTLFFKPMPRTERR